jgi:branched-chain amino acid transport system permease protein
VELFLATILAGILSGAIYALVGLGFAVLYRSTGLLSLAHGELLMAGSLICYSLKTDWGWPLPLAIVGAIVTSAALNVVIDVVLVRRMRSPNVLRIAVMTFGAALVFRGIAHAIWGTNIYSLPSFPGVPVTYSVGYDRAVLPGQAVYVIGALLLVAAAVQLYETRTRFGWMMRSVGADAPMARTLGIPAGVLVAVAFAIAGGLAGLAGAVTTPILFMTSSGGTLIGLKGLVATVVGGFDLRFGAVAGGLLLGLLEQGASAYVGAGWQDAAVFILLIVALLWRPQGLLMRTAA